MEKMEKRQELINRFLTKRHFIDEFINEFSDFLCLQGMGENEAELMDLKEIAECVGFAMGSLDQAFDLVYAFDSRIKSEKILEEESKV